MTQNQTDIGTHVDSALTEILGYPPAREEDLTGAMDSIQRLELLIAIEERLGGALSDHVIAGDTWWASRDTIVAVVTETIARDGAAELH